MWLCFENITIQGSIYLTILPEAANGRYGIYTVDDVAKIGKRKELSSSGIFIWSSTTVIYWYLFLSHRHGIDNKYYCERQVPS